VRQEGRRAPVSVRRMDGQETSWVFPTWGAPLPQDGVHRHHAMAGTSGSDSVVRVPLESRVRWTV